MSKNVLTPILERFWARVRKTSGCWMWTGAKTTHGYGMLGKGRRSDGCVYAHRLSYEVHVGPIPAGKIIMHLCNNFCCVNPQHLRAGTYRENILQAYKDGLR